MRRVYLCIGTILVGVSVAATPAVAARTCAEGGTCRVGDTGPGGGLVFHVAATPQWWGRVLEGRAYKRVSGLPWSLKATESLYDDSGAGTVARQRIDAKKIGMGRVNTDTIVTRNGPGRYAAAVVDRAVLGGESDWFLPSKDEMDAFWNVQAVRGKERLPVGPYWTSSENSPGFAWYQMSQDGTQFTDENGVGQINGVHVRSNKTARRNARHVGSGFPSLPFRVVAVRAFGDAKGSRPPVSNPTLTGNTCTEAGPCRVGDLGPAGGVIFYDAGSHQPWGRWLEAAPESAEVDTYPWRILPVNNNQPSIYVDRAGVSARVQRINNKAIGMGRSNTRRIVRTIGRGRYAARYAWTLTHNGHSDWFLPSEGELYEMYSMLHSANVPIGGFKRGFYWSSSEYDLRNAWTVNFKDGQMFDREKWKIGTATTKPLRIRPVRAFG